MKKLFRDFWIKIRNKLILWNNNRRGFFRLDIRNKIPRLIVHEKYEKHIKWVLRVLMFVGILSSVLSFPWLLSLLVSIILILIEQIFEKIIFTFTTLFVQLFPEYQSEEWLGMLFLISTDQSDNCKLGMLFRTKEYGEKIYECLKAWNYYHDVDMENNIRVSFIFESDSEYSTYIYPSPERKTIKKAKEDADREMLEKKKIKEQQQLIFMGIFCKLFPNLPNSNFQLFRKHYKKGDPFEFGVYFINSTISENKGETFVINNKQIKEISIGTSIIKHHLKIKKRDELTKKDVEYHHGKLIMNK